MIFFVLQPKKIQKCLQKLVRALEKDRHHTLQHYFHMIQKNIKNADKMKDDILDHLEHLNKVYNQSLDMLDKYPDIANKVKEPIRKCDFRYNASKLLIRFSSVSSLLTDEFWTDVRNRLEADLPSELIDSLSRDNDDVILQYYKHNAENRLNGLLPFPFASLSGEN